jgi:RNA polymerase sigma-70 factor (ECF subfamily)
MFFPSFQRAMPVSPENNAGQQASPVRDLVAAAQRGDMKAFGELYARYSRMVHGVLLARVPSSDAEDLVQEVFLSALRKLKALRDPAAFGGWLIIIARNRAMDFYRERANSVEVSEQNAHDERKTQATLVAEAVLQIIQKLPEAYRETLVLRLVEGMTGPEIAERTGLSHGSVRVNLHRGMELLRQALRKEAGQ